MPWKERSFILFIKKDSPSYKEKVRRSIKIESPDITALLVDFLSDALSLSQINREIYNKVRFVYFSETLLDAELEGVKVGSFDRDIKAVTYHEANIKELNEGAYSTLLVFDI